MQKLVKNRLQTYSATLHKELTDTNGEIRVKLTVEYWGKSDDDDEEANKVLNILKQVVLPLNPSNSDRELREYGQHV